MRRVLGCIASKRSLLFAVVGAMFEYDPLSRMALVKALAQTDAPLRLRSLASRWLLVRLWLIQFDDSPEVRRNARRIWNS